MYYLGIDGCGRYTKLLMLDDNNKVIGRHSGAATDLLMQPAASVAHNAASLVREIWRLTNTTHKNFNGLCFAAPLSVVSEHETALIKMFKNIGFTCNIKVAAMERALLAAKIGDSPGVLLLAGNDVSGYIKRGDNTETYAGNYGRIIETGGSTYSIGINILRHVVMAADGRGNKTILTDSVTKEFGLNNPSEIIGYVNSKNLDPLKISDLSGLLINAVQHGDNTAVEIVKKAALDLTVFGKNLIEQAKFRAEQTNLVLGGSIFLLNEYIFKQTSSELKSFYPSINLQIGDEKTELGAAILAR